MRLFLDTNVILATLIDDDETADVAAQLLDSDAHEFVISGLTVMELRSVLAKNHQLPREQVESIVSDLVVDVDVFLLDSGDFTAAIRLQQETLLYPMDAMILTCARETDTTLVSFDAELQEHGAVAPSEIV